MIITGLGMGGAERQVCDLADQFSQIGHEVFLISLTGETILKPLSSHVEIEKINMKKTLFGFIRAYWRVCTLIKKIKPDVVHSHMVHANIFARLLRLNCQMKKLICTAHNTTEGGRSRILAYRLTDFLCDISTNVSQEAVDAFIDQGAVPPNRMIVMHNGIDANRFIFNLEHRVSLRKQLNLADDTPLILSVGRFNIQKDYPNLLNAFAISSNYLSKLNLAIIGEGEEKEATKVLAEQLGVTSRIHFLGLQRNVYEWMSAADLFVLSSAWEGFGLVVAEAMACERVVVATDCGGVKEVVGDCGILVPPKNSAALAQGLDEGLKLSQESAKAKGLLARERIIASYSLSAQAERWLELYQFTRKRY